MLSFISRDTHNVVMGSHNVVIELPTKDHSKCRTLVSSNPKLNLNQGQFHKLLFVQLLLLVDFQITSNVLWSPQKHPHVSIF